MGRTPGSKNKPKIATMTMEDNPTMADPVQQEAAAPPPTKPNPKPKPKPKATVDYDAMDRQAIADEEGDMLRIPPEIIPDGMRYNWKTYSVFGQIQARRFGRYEATGWSPVPASRHPGLFTPKGYQGMIEYDGLVLCEKPEELCMRAEAREVLKAKGQVLGKEAQIRGGDIDGVRFDTKGRAARTNKVGKSYEPFSVPQE